VRIGKEADFPDPDDKGKPMKSIVRTALRVVALAIGWAAVTVEPRANQGDLNKGNAISLKELRREPITFELDIPYADTGNPRHRLDLYLPKHRKTDKLPVIVFIHGGGWMWGDKSDTDGVGRLIPFIRTGEYAGVSIGYRLSGEAQWPAQIHDCKAAIRWLRANAAKYALDADHIGVWGRSAGSHLGLMLGMTGDVPELEGDIGPYRDVSSKVAAVAEFSGRVDLLASIGQPNDADPASTQTPGAMLIGGPLFDNSDKARAASPITYVTANDPPVLIVHGSKDSTVPYDQAVRLDAALQQAGVPSYFVTVKGGGHGDFGSVADDRVRAFFARYLRGENVEISTKPLNKPLFIWRQ
jgi:acetyl esterase/lipase